jgi:polysaccharide pyruvyl transferase WcaK-like protein
MNILLVSTLGHNPGDEFIRLGVEHLLRQVHPNAQLRTIHKHDPRTLFAGFKQRSRSPHRRIAPLLYRLYAKSYGRWERNYLEAADLIVFAGTPFIWRSSVRMFPFTCENAEWVDPVWRRLLSELKETPVVNLCAGTSLTSADQASAILADPVVSGFLRQAVGRTELTTARDVITRDILAELGFQVDIIPCASIMAAKGAYLSASKPEYVAINLMRSAAHSWRGQRGESARWRQTIGAAVAEIEKRHQILFISHSEDEDSTAAEWFPRHRRFFSKDSVELLKVYSKALYGLCNRVHAAAAVASFGRPAIVVGGDSRINLIEQFGLPAFDHRELDGPGLLNVVQVVEDSYDVYVGRLRERMLSAERAYVQAIAAVPVTFRAGSGARHNGYVAENAS